MTHNGTADGFTADELAAIESVLLERRRQLLGDFRALEDADAQNAPDGSAMPSHLAELGSDLQASDISLGRRESESSEIQEIDEALARIRRGSFGLCEACETPISKARLEAIPYAGLCLACKTLEET
jgi:DnaK suppressor protein